MIHTLHDVCRAVRSHDGCPTKLKFETIDKVVRTTLIGVIGLNALADAGQIHIDLGNGYILLGELQEKKA